MNKMKLSLVMLLAFSLLLAACGGKSEEGQGGSSDGASGEVKPLRFSNSKPRS